jgi:ABC-2 type transport system ATP-binding protein
MSEPVITAVGLAKRFGTVEALRELDLEVERGEVFGYLGPNGAGKTTTIRLLLDFIRPTSGRVEVLGGTGAGSVTCRPSSRSTPAGPPKT